ncbi:hypothetical protein M9Y10_022465 [Tritrichomonas musculus]|uniref:Leucine Rich Repeat family protein n=1 Tax=Tritrichomonas musculus TaxID=1915356 RepID=A0ABR2KT79_9EUKA
MSLSPSSSKVYPRTIIVPNQNLEDIPIPSDPILVSYIDCSNNPIKTFKKLPQLKNLEKILGDNTLLESFEGVVEQPSLAVLSLSNTPISEHKYFVLMALIAFGHSLQVVNDEVITTRDLDNQLKYGPIIRDHIFKGYIIARLKPVIELVKPDDGSKLTLSYSPTKSYFSSGEKESNIFNSPMSSISLTKKDFDELVKPHHVKKIQRDPIDILNYHKAAVARFQGSLQREKYFLRQHAFDENTSLDLSKISVNDDLDELDNIQLNEFIDETE